MKRQLRELVYCAYYQGYESSWDKIFKGKCISLKTYLILKEIAQTY